MSPDWSAKAEPIPYAKLDNPQSLNLYEYVGNSPINKADADGHGCPGNPACPIAEAFQGLLNGDNFKASLKSGWDRVSSGFSSGLSSVKSYFGAKDGQITTAGGTVTLTAQTTTGNVSSDSTGKQAVVIGPPDMNVGVNASIHLPGQEAGPASISVSSGPVGVGATTNSIEVSASTSTDPKIVASGSVSALM